MSVVAVTHHLDDQALRSVIYEIWRVLKPGGSLVLLDALWMSERWRSKLLWRYDRGSYPRTAEVLQQELASRFRLVVNDTFAVHHTYVLYWAIKEA